MRSEFEQTIWNVTAGAAGGAIRHLLRFLLDPGKRWPALVAGTITGVCVSVFVTPMIASQIDYFGTPEKATGLAFGLGLLGMEAVELIVARVRKQLSVDAEAKR